MKLKKKNYIHLAILFAAYTLLVIGITHFEYAYGSKLDWSSQHYAIPDYFRKLFYDTGDFFPSYALNIGGGENIYNLSYYGLFSPIILFSYLLPFVKMRIYIQAISYIGVLVSTYIFYRWMLKKFNENTAFLLSIVFMFAGPLILHSHRHIMFVSYMPFLLLSFMAVEEYMVEKKKYKIVLFPFLMILTCYFFAVSGIVAVTIYGVYYYLKIHDKFVFKEFLRKGFHYAGRILTAVLMSCILLMPTVYCLLSGRDKGHSKIDLSTLMPSTNVRYFMFGSYSAGLGLFVICAVICAVLAKQKHRRFLGITMALFLLCPVFIFILNGTLYIDSKVLIPFMPILVIMIGQAYNELLDKTFKWKIIMPITILYGVLSLLIDKTTGILLVSLSSDIVVVTVCILLYYRKNKKLFANLAVCLTMICSSIALNFADKLMPLSDIRNVNSEDINTLAEYANKDTDLVRTSNCVDVIDSVNLIYNTDYLTANIYSSLHNKHYNNFYFNEIYNENEFRNSALTTQSQSILYDIYMSEKYLITDSENAPIGYEKIAQKGSHYLYENKTVLPFGYATSKIMGRQEYDKLSYPYSLEALINYTIVDNAEPDTFTSEIMQTQKLDLIENESIKDDNGVYTVNTKKTIKENIKLKNPVANDKILLVSFDIDNDIGSKKGDAKVTLNGEKNTLTDPSWKYYNNNTTFEYVISPKNGEALDNIEVTFSAGHYKISNIRCYVMDYPDKYKNVDKFIVNKEKTKGDVISGEIDVTENGFFNISLPYTDGYSVTVDGNSVKAQMTDTAFLGFEISKGHHVIEIKFTSPLQREGLITSAAGILIFIILILFERKKSNDK